MVKFLILFLSCFLLACSASQKKNLLAEKTFLPQELKEISGMTASGSDIWAISDKPRPRLYRLDLSGTLQQQVNITNTDAIDVEAVASDTEYLYIGDLGDNTGDRIERKIIKVAKANVTSGTQATGEIITFTFAGDIQIEKKKLNNFDCESLLAYGDSLYVFTKDREDNETRLYVLPKTPGKYVARFISSFNSKGLITDAAINTANDELALIGYHKGHKFPFIILFDTFSGNDFFSGNYRRIDLADKDWDWQLESITYGDDDTVYFACEGTKQVPATFYSIDRKDLPKLDKRKKQNSKSHNDEESDITAKGHLKM